MKKFGLLVSVLAVGILLSACGNKSVGTDTLEFDDAYGIFVDNLMQDKIEQLEVVADRETVFTDSTILIGMDNEMAQAEVAINTTALVSEGNTSGVNIFDVNVVSDLLQLDGLVAISHFSDVVSTYYRLDEMEIEMGGLLAGNLSYVDLMKEQLASLIGQWYLLDSDMLLGEAAGASQLTDSLRDLPTDVYEGLRDNAIFEVKEQTEDEYKVILSEDGFLSFLDQLSDNEYVAGVFDLPTTGGVQKTDEFIADVTKINESVDMTLKILDDKHVDLVVSYASGTAMNFAMTLGYKGLLLTAGDSATATTADISRLQKSDGKYDINATVAQSGVTMVRADGVHLMSFEDDTMNTTIDLNVFVANTLINLPIEEDEILVTITIDSDATHVEKDVMLTAPTDAQKFEDFLGSMAGEYLEGEE